MNHEADWQYAPGAPPPDEAWWSAVLEQGEFVSFSGATAEGGSGEVEAPTPQPSPVHAPAPAATEGRPRARTLAEDWQAVRAAYRADQVVNLVIVGHNRGGLLAAWGNLRGFIPASHIVGFPADLREAERKTRLAQRIGQRMRLKIIELDGDNGRVVLSERAAQAGPGRRTEVLERLAPGAIVEGVVSNVCDFGAFVDLGGVEGLVHVSEVSWGRVAHPRDALSIGQKVTVYVISVDRERAHVALSLKRLQPDPWATVEERYTVGQLVQGTITHVAPFGAFACIEAGLEGLIHVSELAEGQFMHPRNVVREGDRVTARIVNIDGAGRRLGLSLRRAGQEWQMGAVGPVAPPDRAM